ncbi:hypothetical protein Aperf_G00000035322 [Anoplocephala perfoliata]
MAYVKSAELECAICFKRYNDPVSLPCAHNFCHGCIENSLKDAGVCPTCGAPTKMEDVKPDAKLQRIINGIHSDRKFCGECQDHTDELEVCGDCDKPLCKKCLKKHIDQLRIEVNELVQFSLPKSNQELTNYREKLSKVEGRIDIATKKAESELKTEEDRLVNSLINMRNHNSEFESNLKCQFDNANTLRVRVMSLMEKPIKNSADSDEVDDILEKLADLRRSVDKCKQSNLPAATPMNGSAIEALHLFNVLEEKPLC